MKIKIKELSLNSEFRAKMSTNTNKSKELENILSIVEQHYKEWSSDSKRNESGYAYESTFVKMMQNMSKEMFQSSLGDLSTNRNSKKNCKPL